MRIDLADPDDARLLADVGAATEAAYAEFVAGPDDDYRIRLRDAAARAREAELWVATEDGIGGGRVLGSVTLCPVGSPWREIGRDDEGEFRMLAVDPAARGRGVGEALVRHVLDRFAAAGTPTTVLSTLVEMTAAHRIYDRLGFVRVPARDWSPHPGVDLLAYVRTSISPRRRS